MDPRKDLRSKFLKILNSKVYRFLKRFTLDIYIIIIQAVSTLRGRQLGTSWGPSTLTVHFYKTWRTNGTFSGPRTIGSCNIVHSKLIKTRYKNDIQIYLVKLGYPLIVKVLDNYSVDLIDSFDGWSRMIIPYWWPIRVDYTYERDMTKYKPF